MVASSSGSAPSFLSRIGWITLQEEGQEHKKRVSYQRLSHELQGRINRILETMPNWSEVGAGLQNSHGELSIVLRRDGTGDHFVTIAGEGVKVLGYEVSDLFRTLFDDSSAAIQEEDVDYFRQWVEEAAKQRESSPDAESWPSFASWMIALASDGLGVFRNTLSAHQGPAMSIAGLGVAGGAVSVMGGLIMTLKGLTRFNESRRIGDTEGVTLASFYTAAGVNYIGVGVALAMIHGSTLHGPAAASVGSAAGQIIIPLVVAMNLALLSNGAYEIQVARSFRDSLKESVELHGPRGGIEFLKQELSLTKEELAKLEEITDLDQRKSALEILLKCKQARFERRTDPETFKKVLAKIEEFATAFSNGTANAETIRDATSLLDTVMEANYKKMVKSAILILLALAGIASVIVALTMTGGAPAIAFAVVSGMWIVLDSFKGSDKIADLFWKIHLKLFDSKLLTTDVMKEIEDLLKLLGSRAKVLSDGWMERLYARDPSLRSASQEVKDSAFKNVYSGTWASYRQLASNLAHTSVDTMEFLHLKLDREFDDLRDAKKMLDKIKEICPELADAFTQDERKKNLSLQVEEGFFGWEAVLRAMKLPYAREQEIRLAVQFFDLADEIRSSPSAKGLDRQSGRISYLQKEMPHFWDLIAKHAKDDVEVDQAIEDAKSCWLAEQPSGASLSESEKIKNAAIYFLRAHFNLIAKREAVFGRFDEDTIAKIAQEEGPQPLMPLLQIASALEIEFPPGQGDAPIVFPTLLLSEGQKRILQSASELHQIASERFPEFFMECLKTADVGSYDSDLQIDIFEGTLVEIELAGQTQTVRVPVQTKKDLNRNPLTKIVAGEEESQFENGDGENALLRLHKLAEGDNVLFLSLASLYNQGAKNFSLQFMQPLLEVMSGLYTPITDVKMQTIKKQAEDSYEVRYDFKGSLLSMRDGSLTPLEFSTVFYLERGPETKWRWVASKPSYILDENPLTTAG